MSLLKTPIQYVKGVGPKIASFFKKRDIYTVYDGFFFLPKRYEDRRKITPLCELKVGQFAVCKAKVASAGEKTYKKGAIFEVIFEDGSGFLVGKWFNFNEKHMKRIFKEGKEFIISGEVKRFIFSNEMHHPEFEEYKSEDSLNFGRIVPIYPELGFLTQSMIRKIMKNLLSSYLVYVKDLIPEEIRKRHGLIPLKQAIYEVHFPKDDEDLTLLSEMKAPCQKTLIFYELFFLELGLALKKRDIKTFKAPEFVRESRLLDKFISSLPFDLTNAQKRVLHEIKKDFISKKPANRLIQGDVGSGKTVVAIACALLAKDSGYQTAIMAPTEILAYQHERTIKSYLKDIDVKVELLTSDLKKREKERIKEKISNGEIDVVCGTHALISSDINFSNLGLVIIDEQHRFGVVQRQALRQKGKSPHVIVMTATPIPRTLALTVYGDLDISVIDELPKGRQKVITKLFHEYQRYKVYDFLKSEIKKGRQAYIVYPVLDESKMGLLSAKEMFNKLKDEVFSEFRLALLHGKMRKDEKDEIMAKFMKGEIDILVATTVVEVGIDIPNATVMVIEHAERFGLSQLHQLRGRVGRGSKRSYCILLSQYKKSSEARRRLEVMVKTSDGFKIAEEDLKIRGPGEFLGTKQSGLPGFKVANIVRDTAVLSAARDEAFLLVSKDPELRDHKEMFRYLSKNLGERLDFAQVG